MSSMSLLPTHSQLPEDINEQNIPSTGFPSYTADAVVALNHRGLDSVLDIVSDTASETSPRVGDGETGPIEHLAQELAEQLIKFQGSCNECHQAARSHHMEDPNYHIGLAEYFEFTPELGPDILGSDTIAHQKDDLTGKLSPNPEDRPFVILTLERRSHMSTWILRAVLCLTVGPS
ncbi:hypothetical protein IWW34DRAFT_839061 [Fusarium oxysporum f. sp. albedinis]|nr:hypothetical protein IWW34DRAFT_839061 [Fusarium oxysporum f. sp. albedinis]